ncbi:MAG: type I-U CRISPR-associated helicase/endonuclease Cas3 [Xanthobacteraceae bacterium]
MNDVQFFDASFEALTGHAPLRWQRRLFSAFLVEKAYDAVDLPTGLGKTSVIAVWLIALAAQTANGRPSLPRRLVYVVDRRTVVDQATDTAERMRNALRTPLPDPAVAEMRARLSSLCLDPTDDASPLAITTLRGEHADNREWQVDPARPAIIVGTVDMIGSRLLFEGYGISRRMRPFHAGLLGQDTLLVHDEAHLSPAFGELVRAIASTQQGQGGRRAPRPFRVLELSATQRKEAPDREAAEAEKVFALDDADRADAEVTRRINATKTLRFETTGDKTASALATMIGRALEYSDTRERILVYVSLPKEAKEIAAGLAAKAGEKNVALLTGTIRGYERDRLADGEVFRAFRPERDRKPPPRTLYLVATSAGEVGVDLDADHLFCDLAPLDSMIQRFGRVNRLGRGTATVHVFELSRKAPKNEDSTSVDLIAATKEALQSLPSRDGGFDASPEALRGLTHRTDAFSKPPRRLPLTDILLDTWALTRVENLPGRPPVARWLHGVEGDRPQLYVAWRDEIDQLAEADSRSLKMLYDKHPILARERLRGPLGEVLTELKKITKRRTGQDAEELAALSAILIPPSGDPIQGTLADLLENEARLSEATIVLPPAAGGLDVRGMLDAGAGSRPFMDVADTSDAAETQRSSSDGADAAAERMRVLLTWNTEAERWSARQLGTGEEITLDEPEPALTVPGAAAQTLNRVSPSRRLVQKDLVILANDDEGEATKALLLLAQRKSVASVQDNPASASSSRSIAHHLADVRSTAQEILARLGSLLADEAKAGPIAEAIVLAALHHDRGKDRDPWQADIGNRRRPEPAWTPLAKSGRSGFVSRLSGSYRHEFGSLREAADDPIIADHPERDLILHLIAAHHGWARPHFEERHWDIADGVTEDENAAVAAETMRRFARLQRRFGHWGLAWLEALIRAADYAASKRIPDEADERAAGAAGARGEAREAQGDNASRGAADRDPQGGAA